MPIFAHFASGSRIVCLSPGARLLTLEAAQWIMPDPIIKTTQEGGTQTAVRVAQQVLARAGQ